MFQTCRVAHIRYRNGQHVHKSFSDHMDRVVTVIWNYYPKKNILTYGATVYKKSGMTDRWSKQEHYDQAKTRFDVAPIMIKFDLIEPFSKKAMDRYIADKVIYFYGCFSTVKDHTHAITKPISLRNYDPYFYLNIRTAGQMETKNEGCNIMTVISIANVVGLGLIGVYGLTTMF